MSIAILTQVYDEVRRLAIAGSVVGGGDFRLKKLVPALEQAGVKAPVFAKVAEAAKAVVESKEQNSAPALLELTALVNAILYTQGETGAAGTLEPIATTGLGAPKVQASARVLKPLLEALTTTGSGRLEVIRDAHEQGAFFDLRLVKPALDAIDDGYGEIGDFIANQVLPAYGKAILRELRSKFDLKGRAGHPRRLRLMHFLDPVRTRDLVEQALDIGSKEVKVVAIECLGAQKEDLAYLIDQASAKANEVRQAAYRALAKMDDDAAVAVLQKALGDDLGLVQYALVEHRNVKLTPFIVATAEEELAALGKIKDKTEVGKKLSRFITLMTCLVDREDKAAEAFVLKVFGLRADLAKIKGEPVSGSDLNTVVVRIMERGTQCQQAVLADAHATLPAEDLPLAFQAARREWPADKVYTQFHPYLTAKVDEKKKQRDPAGAKREALLAGLAQGRYFTWSDPHRDATDFDPRWLDVAVRIRHLGLVRHLIHPGHAAANAFLKKTFDETFKDSKHLLDCQDVVAAMIQAVHPKATDAYFAILEKFGTQNIYFGHWFGGLLVQLPKAALPRFDALMPKLNDKVADSLLGYIQQLREKP